MDLNLAFRDIRHCPLIPIIWANAVMLTHNVHKLISQTTTSWFYCQKQHIHTNIRVYECASVCVCTCVCVCVCVCAFSCDALLTSRITSHQSFLYGHRNCIRNFTSTRVGYRQLLVWTLYIPDNLLRWEFLCLAEGQVQETSGHSWKS